MASVTTMLEIVAPVIASISFLIAMVLAHLPLNCLRNHGSFSPGLVFFRIC